MNSERLAAWLPRFSLLAVLALVGCGGGGHQIRGVVLEGTSPEVLIVSSNDPRLKNVGIAGAIVDIWVDPDEPRPKQLQPTRTDDSGNFAVASNAPGAGMLEYQLSVLARAAGHQSVEENVPMPGGNKRLLIVLAPGRDKHQSSRDLLGETMRMKEQIEKQ